MNAVIPVVVGFLLTGLIGNRLLHAWQTRSWLMQQRFLGREKEFTAFKELADEIATILGARIYRMQRLSRLLLSSDDQKLEEFFKDYSDILKEWNERLTSFLVRLQLLSDAGLGFHLEQIIQPKLVETGAKLEKMVAARRKGVSLRSRDVAAVLSALNSLNGQANNFNKDVLRSLKSRRIDIYYGRRIEFSALTIENFSTWQLFKALWVRDVDSLSIARSPLDP